MCFLFRLGLCVLAMGIIGCSDDGTATRTIGADFPDIDTLVLTINRSDGFMQQWRSEEYTFSVRDLTVSHRWLQDSDPPMSLGPATREAMDQLVMVVQSVSYRVNEDCLTLAVDGAPYSPKLDIRHGQKHLQLGVSDNDCAESDHSYVGPVMSCAASDIVFAAVREIVPRVTGERCAFYW